MNTKIPIIIPTFNNPTYVAQMIKQLDHRNKSEIIIMDSNSTYEPMLKLLKELKNSYQVRMLGDNFGPRYFADDLDFYDSLPNFFIVTDPDLEFNTKMPLSFLDNLIEISEKYQSGKVGLNLNINSKSLDLEQKYIIDTKIFTLAEWEIQLRREMLGSYNGNPIYKTATDTTFALYNKKYFKAKNFFESLRVGGDYECTHLPWMKTDIRPKEEIEFYKSLNKFGYWIKPDPLHFRYLNQIKAMESTLSWKITKPIRDLSDMRNSILKRLKNK